MHIGFFKFKMHLIVMTMHQ